MQRIPEAPLVLPRAGPASRVLLVHAPFPGRLKFEAQPSSLLAAAAPLAHGLAREGRLAELGCLDPGSTSRAFYAELEALIARGSVAAVCISTSTAAIEEAARIAELVRSAAPNDPLIVGGGPHEDDVDEPMVERIPGLDLSIAGDSEDALALLVRSHLASPSPARPKLDPSQLLARATLRGSGQVASHGGQRFRWSRTAPPSLEDLATRPFADKPVHFSVFPGRTTLPLMVSRGCAYGRCSFCAEGGSGGAQYLESFEHLVPLLEAHPGSALYFQDSIFPRTRAVRERLLPLLRDSARPWGCQVYLPHLSRDFVHELAAHGCRYVYTGIESGAESLRAAVGKRALRNGLVHERLGWLADEGLELGLSLMFGALAEGGALLETERTVGETLDFVGTLVTRGVPVAGVYPNVLTVLPGTRLARSLATPLDFYRMPRTEAFADLEDGAVGHNFVTLGLDPRGSLTERIVAASAHLSTLGGRACPRDAASL